MQFLDGATIENKLAAVFLYLNNGDPITAAMISKLLKHVYPETKDVCQRTLTLKRRQSFFILFRMKSKLSLINLCDNWAQLNKVLFDTRRKISLTKNTFPRSNQSTTIYHRCSTSYSTT